MVDVLGIAMKMCVHDANIQDRDGISILLKDIKKKFPKLKLLWVDAGYQGPRVREVAKAEGLRVEVVKRPRSKGFKLLKRRWVVERTFAWFEPARRLAKDYERNHQTQETWMEMRMVKIIINRITK